jgi:uncharacterized membrane protein YciS (DUF1049 family)
MPSVLPTFLLLLSVDAIPVAAFTWRIVVHARRVRISPVPFAVNGCLFGLSAGMASQAVAVQYFLTQAQQMEPWPWRVQVAAVFGVGLLASAATSGLVYLFLRMRTARDEDYEEPGSHVADVREPRDGEDLIPK